MGCPLCPAADGARTVPVRPVTEDQGTTPGRGLRVRTRKQGHLPPSPWLPAGASASRSVNPLAQATRAPGTFWKLSPLRYTAAIRVGDNPGRMSIMETMEEKRTAAAVVLR